MTKVETTPESRRTARQRYVEQKRREELEKQKVEGDLEQMEKDVSTVSDPVREAVSIDQEKGDFTQRRLSQNLGRDVTDMDKMETWRMLKAIQKERMMGKEKKEDQ